MVNSIVIGNGTSRRGLDLKLDAYTIACNWFFRDEFEPDILVTSDEDITAYISKRYPDLKCHHKSTPKYTSGATGTYLAVNKLNSNNVFLVGMDFNGNNLYSGKLYYENTIEPDTSDWKLQFEAIIKDNPDTNFYHIGKSPELLTNLNNFHQSTYDEMIQIIGGKYDSNN